MINAKKVASRVCTDITKIENYDKALNDDSQEWQCHHRLETHNSDGELRSIFLSREELIALDMYWHRPPEELIYLTRSEHMTLHNSSKQYREKMKKSCKGINQGAKSEEMKKHLSESCKGRTPWNKGKKSTSQYKHWKLVDGKRVYF